MNTIDCKVVMLPKKTSSWSIGELLKCIKKDNTQIKGDIGDLSYITGTNSLNAGCWKPQYIYFLSDEEIKEGDWYYFTHNNDIHRLMNSITKLDTTVFKKVVASTDPLLGLPSIPEEWIRTKYVPSNSSIKEVKLTVYEHSDCPEEAQLHPFSESTWYQSHISKPKLINNEVVIVDEPKTVGGLAGTDMYKQACIDQTLEDAANEYISKNKRFADTGRAFKAGVEWQKEKFANEAVEFAEWITDNIKLWMKLPFIKWITSKELYELWQKTK